MLAVPDIKLNMISCGNTIDTSSLVLIFFGSPDNKFIPTKSSVKSFPLLSRFIPVIPLSPDFFQTDSISADCPSHTVFHTPPANSDTHSIKRAALPVTNGVAMEVPLILVFPPPGLAPRIPTPGAVTSGFSMQIFRSPLPEKDA